MASSPHQLRLYRVQRAALLGWCAALRLLICTAAGTKVKSKGAPMRPPLCR